MRSFEKVTLLVILIGLVNINIVIGQVIMSQFDDLNRLKETVVNGCLHLFWQYDQTGNRTLHEIKGGTSLYTKVYLQGAYNSNSGLLNDNIREATLIPIEEPYASFGLAHLRDGGGEKTDFSVFSTTGNNAIVDWVFIELRDKNDSTVVITTRSALVQRDGDIVDYDGISPVRFINTCPDDFYVVIRHRNHLGVMTNEPVTLTEAPTSTVDFTDPSLQTWGTNAQRISNGVRMMWSGDANGNAIISYNGANNDKNAILFLVGLFTPNDVIPGYYRQDITMDGYVKYNGAANDKNAILFNVGLFTPNNIITEQLP